jgi:hypothetical protein
MGEATKIRDLEHLILHAGGDVAVAREALRALQRKACDALAGEGGEVLGGTPAQFAELLRTEREKWARIVKESGAKVD